MSEPIREPKFHKHSTLVNLINAQVAYDQACANVRAAESERDALCIMKDEHEKDASEWMRRDNEHVCVLVIDNTKTAVFTRNSNYSYVTYTIVEPVR